MRLSVAEIEIMDRAALIAAWDHLFGEPVPKSLSQAFLRRFLAFEIQARRSGGLPKAVEAELGRRASGRGPASSPALRPGARLLREWNGVTHEVTVTGTGYFWNRETYPSLSAVARAITGAHWSGPRFFGLQEGGR